MIATSCLLTCALAAGQAGDWSLQPQLGRGQELVYAGSFTEETLGGQGKLQRVSKVETRVLVLDAGAQKFDLAVFTSLAPKADAADAGKNASTPASVRLEIVALDRQGKLLPSAAGSLLTPLESPPTIECGAFVEVPKNRLGINAWWEVNEEGRTPRTWRVEGTETINNVSCVRLVGLQQSEDWNTPRADRAAWQRRDIMWISAQFGYTYRFERTIEKRDAARQVPTQRTVLVCEYVNGLTYPAKLFDERCNEIKQARKFYEDADALLRQPEPNRAQLETIVRKIKQHCDSETPIMPYRNAVLQVHKRVEAALRGDTVRDPQANAAPPPAVRAAVGQRVPDFVCTDLLTRQTERLQRMLGKPVVVMFYNPATDNGQNVLRLGQALAQRYPRDIAIMPMAITDDVELVQQQHTALKLPFSILDGNGLLQLFAVDGLPRLVVLDGQGFVRSASTGWGLHTPGEVTAEVQKLMPR